MDDKVFKSRYLLWVAILYFFFNSALLPEGLLYTDLLTPFLLWWLYKKGRLGWMGLFFIVIISFIPVHLSEGVSPWYYLRSVMSLFCSVSFAMAFRVLLQSGPDLGHLFRQILSMNFLVAVAAIIILPFPAIRGVLWYLKEFSPGVGVIPRLKLLTYEASYYSLLFVPLALYFYLRLFLFRDKDPWRTFIMVTMPLALSLSLGVIAGVGLTLFILLISMPSVFLPNTSTLKFLLSGAFIGLLVLTGLMILMPHNPLSGRIRNIFSGNDTSFRGRTYESFVLAWRIARQKSILFGCGPGQPKIVGIPVFQTYYGYLPPVVRLPNTLADTLAVYGLTGLFIRLAFTVWMFFKARVSRNYYQLSMFIFMFIYQFTGSFLTNIAEYVIWVLAFVPVFTEFNRQPAFPGPYRQQHPILTRMIS